MCLAECLTLKRVSHPRMSKSLFGIIVWSSESEQLQIGEVQRRDSLGAKQESSRLKETKNRFKNEKHSLKKRLTNSLNEDQID